MARPPAHRAKHTAIAAAPVQACFDAITDFASYADWVGSVKSVSVLEDGPEPLVEFRVDAKVRTIRYVLRYHMEPPQRVWWDYVEGDAKSVEGEYRFEPDPASGGTRLTYELAIDPGVFLPGPVKKILVEHVMKGSVDDLVRRVEAAGK